MDLISDDTILSAVLPISYGGEDRIRTYAAVEKRSASLSQSAIRFHLGQIWATISKSLILNSLNGEPTP